MSRIYYLNLGEEEETLQMFVLYVSWTSENQLSEAESTKKLTVIIFLTQ